MRKSVLRFFSVLTFLVSEYAQSTSSVQKESLETAIEQIRLPSKISFHIEPSLAQDKIYRQSYQGTWSDVVRTLLQDYNWTGVWDPQGHLTAVSVTGRNGSGYPSLRTASSTPKTTLFAYDTRRTKLPVQYQTNPDAVYPITIPVSRLRQMKKGERVSVNLPDGRYEFVHDTIWRHDNGDTTWSGYIDSTDEGHFRALVTLSEDGLAEGQIRTPGGEYYIESERTGNWLIDLPASGLQPGTFEGDMRDPSSAWITVPFPISASTPIAAASSVISDTSRTTVPTSVVRNATINMNGEVVLDLALLYTQGLNNGKVLTRLNNLVATANQALKDSKTNLVLRLVATKQVNYPNTGSNDIALDNLTQALRGFESVPSLRQSKGADMVLLIRPFRLSSQGGTCGTAWVNGSGNTPLQAELAYGVVSYGQSEGYYCSQYTLAHEIGHILGATHDRAHATVLGKYTYSFGYGIEGRFGDVMSYINPEVGLYANPDLILCDGSPCGIPTDQPKPANVVQTFKQTALTVSGFKKSVLP